MVKSMSETAASLTSGGLGFNFLLNYGLGGSLSSLWSMLNSLQIAVHASMFERVKFPNNAQTFNGSLIGVANFEMINTSEWIDSHLVTWEDGNPFSNSFEECGVETTWLLANSSVIMWLYSLNLAVFIVYLLVRWMNKRFKVLSARRQKLESYFFFNGVIRLFMETFLDLYLTSLLNVITAAN